MKIDVVGMIGSIGMWHLSNAGEFNSANSSDNSANLGVNSAKTSDNSANPNDNSANSSDNSAKTSANSANPNANSANSGVNSANPFALPPTPIFKYIILTNPQASPVNHTVPHRIYPQNDDP